MSTPSVLLNTRQNMLRVLPPRAVAHSSSPQVRGLKSISTRLHRTAVSKSFMAWRNFCVRQSARCAQACNTTYTRYMATSMQASCLAVAFHAWRVSARDLRGETRDVGVLWSSALRLHSILCKRHLRQMFGQVCLCQSPMTS